MTFYGLVKEVPQDGACECENCVMWTIAHQDQGELMEIGQSWQGPLGKEAAEDICDLMNMAYDAGMEVTTQQRGKE